MKINEMCLEERPREKMLEAGPGAMSAPELLAILLRTGNSESGVLDLARELYDLSGRNLVTLFSLSVDHICTIKGIGKSKAVTLMAAAELGRRFFAEKNRSSGRPVLKDSSAVYGLMIPQLKGKTSEECWVLWMNNHNKLIDKQLLTIGSMDATVIDVKKILRSGLEKRASSLILVHNHPSGGPVPSREDIICTRNLKRACQSCEMALLDHVIICDDSYYSFSDDSVSDIPEGLNFPADESR